MFGVFRISRDPRLFVFCGQKMPDEKQNVDKRVINNITSLKRMNNNKIECI